ncbi:MAG TPA: CHASE3 domain-containing protein, partial [Terriglobales bacterium]|nr:CHASE3 domain-containing protein [Terriglobales bacterium]
MEEETNQKWVEHTHSVMEQLDAILLHIQAQELRQRGFAVAGGPVSPDRIGTAITRQKKDVDQLRDLISDNGVQQKALNQLQPLLDSHLELFAKGDGSAVSEQQRISQSENLLEKIREQIRSMKGTEQSLLQVRLSASERSSAETKIIIVSGYAVALLLLLIAGLAILNEFAKRTRSELRLRSAEERYHLLFDSNPLPLW